MQLSFNLEDTERSPRKGSTHTLARMEFFAPSVYGGIDVSKIPLICRDLPVGLHVPLPSKQVKLFFGERGVNHRQWNTVERGIPCSEEWILPSGSDHQKFESNRYDENWLIGHGKDVFNVHVRPIL